MNNNITMIFGAPGCGKTTYLLNLLEEILKENDPDKVAFVSFTKKGSYEGRNRAMEKFGLNQNDLPFFRTIHSLAFRDLGMTTYEMISRMHYKEFSKAMGMNFLGYYTEDLVNNDDKYLFFCSLLKNNGKAAKGLLEDLDLRKVKSVYRNYERYKYEVGIKDFDDLILDFIKKDTTLPVDIAIIDEAQDLTTLQWEFCEVAFRNCKKVYIAGDDDQAIYEWSGADIKKFLSFSKTCNKKIILDKSYRLKKEILDFSLNISNRIINRVDKKFDPIDNGGNIYFHNNLEEININNEESYYFLSRNNYFLYKYKNRLMNLGLTFYNKNKFSVNLNHYEAIKTYERLRKETPHKIVENVVLSSIIRKDSKVVDPWYDTFDLDIKEINYFRDLFKNKTEVNKNNCKLQVNTIHGVKGGEADNVILMLDVTKNVAKNLDKGNEFLDSELRCLYVALTRTKKNLYIMHSNAQFGYDNIIKGV